MGTISEIGSVVNILTWFSFEIKINSEYKNDQDAELMLQFCSFFVSCGLKQFNLYDHSIIGKSHLKSNCIFDNLNRVKVEDLSFLL